MNKNMKSLLKTVLITSMMTATALFAAEVDLTKTTLQWKGTKVTGEHTGKIPLSSAKVVVEKDQLQSGEFVADITNFTVEDLSGEWQTKFITHLKGNDFFEVDKYPSAKLVVKEVANGVANGDLTIKGKTNPVSFPMVKKENSYTGTLKFDRTKFGMIYGSGDFFKGLGDKVINNEVVVDFQLVVK